MYTSCRFFVNKPAPREGAGRADDMGLIGYARVSTAEGEQVLDRQLDALHAADCERVFEDRASGATPDRPGLAACLDHLRKGDVLVVLDLDRLGRLATELVALIDQLAGRGVAFRALNSPMDTTTPAGRGRLRKRARSYASGFELTRSPCAPDPAERACRRRGDESSARSGRREAPQRVSTHAVTSMSRTCVPPGAGSQTAGADGRPKRSSSPSPANDRRSSLSADPGCLRRDGAQRHPSEGPGRASCRPG